MTQSAIFGPFLAMMVLTLVVWIYMYVRRIHFLQTRGVDPRDLEVPGALAEISPADVSNPSDNLKNLFELPVLFYALSLFLFVTEEVDGLYVALGWIFVAFRVLHSAVHCSFNLVMLRFGLYLVSALAVWIMLGRAVMAHLGG